MDQLRAALTSAGRPRGLWPLRPAGILSAVLVAAALSACGPSGRRLANTYESDEAAARAVLEAVARKDADALAGMAITKDEFEQIVWPTLPVSRPEVGMPMDYVWQDTFRKSRAYLQQTLAQYGGQRYELVQIDFRGETTEHEGYTVSREAHLLVRDGSGAERTIRLFGSIIRQDGRSKVYSYILD